MTHPFYRQHLIKPDGRDLWLYSQHPISAQIEAVSPSSTPIEAQPHLRWHPLRGEWVAYASHRQNRTYLPPANYNPFAVTHDLRSPTELPAGDYDIAVFQNRFPTLLLAATTPPEEIVPTQAATGSCEVVVFSQDPQASLATLPLEQIYLLLQVWGDRTQALGEHPHIHYVLPFENKGKEVGVTLHHPHGQIYAYPLIPPVPQRMLEQQQHHWQTQGRSLLIELIEQEIEAAQRIIAINDHAIAFVPVCARYPYEVWVAPRQPVAYFTDLTPAQGWGLAHVLKTVLQKYDGLWQRSFPYLMAWFQAPTDGQAHPEWQLHGEFYPPYRSPDKLKFLAGTELAAGLFANDTLPEAIAQTLQAVKTEAEDETLP